MSVIYCEQYVSNLLNLMKESIENESSNIPFLYQTLYVICQNEKSKDFFIKNGGLKFLMEMIETGNSAIVSYSISVLCSFTKPEQTKMLIEANFFLKIFEIEKSKILRSQLSVFLNEITKEKTHLPLLYKYSTILLSFLSPFDSKLSIQILNNLSYYPPFASKIITSLLNMVKSDKIDVLKQCIISQICFELSGDSSVGKKDSVGKMMKKGMLEIIERIVDLQSAEILNEIKGKENANNEITNETKETEETETETEEENSKENSFSTETTPVTTSTSNKKKDKKDMELEFHLLYTSLSQYEGINTPTQFIFVNVMNTLSNTHSFYKNNDLYLHLVTKKLRKFFSFRYLHPQLDFLAKFCKSLFSTSSKQIHEKKSLLKKQSGDLKLSKESFYLGDKKVSMQFYRNDSPQPLVMTGDHSISPGKYYFEVFLCTSGNMNLGVKSSNGDKETLYTINFHNKMKGNELSKEAWIAGSTVGVFVNLGEESKQIQFSLEGKIVKTFKLPVDISYKESFRPYVELGQHQQVFINYGDIPFKLVDKKSKYLPLCKSLDNKNSINFDSVGRFDVMFWGVSLLSFGLMGCLSLLVGDKKLI